MRNVCVQVNWNRHHRHKHHHMCAIDINLTSFFKPAYARHKRVPGHLKIFQAHLFWRFLAYFERNIRDSRGLSPIGEKGDIKGFGHLSMCVLVRQCSYRPPPWCEKVFWVKIKKWWTQPHDHIMSWSVTLLTIWDEMMTNRSKYSWATKLSASLQYEMRRWPNTR